jgi:transcriptional regulator with XRE-family HTH domain
MSPLEAWMNEKGFDQSDLAQLAGVDRSHISRVQNGKEKPFLKLRECLAKYAPGVLEAQEQYVENRINELLKRAEAA